MKAQFFNKPLNYTLNLDGDEWSQGSVIQGDLNVSNTSSDSIDLTKLGAHLCYCQNKKLKAKDPKGIQILQSSLFLSGKNDLKLNFTLEPNSPITDSSGSLQILCGDIDDPFRCGMIELKVSPAKVIEDFIEVFELYYRFKFKSLKNKKNFIEAQVSPPTTKEWAKVQKMNLQMELNGEDLVVKCICSIKTLSFDTTIHKTKDEKKEILMNIVKKEHTQYGAVNQEGIKKHISKMLEELKLKPIL